MRIVDREAVDGGRVEHAKIDRYLLKLIELHRPPSRGGNTSALHWHCLIIAGVAYSFRALGSQQWVYKSDTVSFEYEVRGPYRNIVKETIRTMDVKGREVTRGNRGFKRQLRTALSRLPVSRREARG